MTDFTYEGQTIELARIKKKTIRVTPWMILFNFDGQGYTIPAGEVSEEVLQYFKREAIQ